MKTTIEMFDNYTITAQFSVNIYNLNIESTEVGEVEKPGEGAFQYEHGEEVNLTAVPEEGWYFEEWTGDY